MFDPPPPDAWGLHIVNLLLHIIISITNTAYEIIVCEWTMKPGIVSKMVWYICCKMYFVYISQYHFAPPPRYCKTN